MRQTYLLFSIPLLSILLTSCIRVNTTNLNTITPLSAEQLETIEVANHTNLDKVTFLVLGDMGTGGANQQAVAEAMGDFCNQPETNCDFITTLGDNIYRDGVSSAADSKLLTRFESPYANLGRIDMWMTPGNHDWLRADSVQSQIDYTTKSGRWRMPNNHYPIPNLPSWLHIYTVDTTILRFNSWSDDDAAINTAADEMLTAAQDALCGQPGWRILFGHHPIYSSGKHGVAETPQGVILSIQDQLEGVIQTCAIQLYMAGHDHHQELIQADGLTQMIQGGGGRYLRPLSPSADMLGERWSAERFGFAAVTATPSQLSIRFFGVDSYGGGWDELCSWTLAADGTLQTGQNGCELE